ncbi:MAG: endonuclease III [Bacilli bacterium]|nr:endonuclease III [Bacilli bacterium]
MTGSAKVNKILTYMDILFVDPKCELNYTKDYELLLAVMMSAQTTDKRVNMVTSVLFKKYPSLEALDQADVKDIEKIIRSIGTYTKKSANIKNIAHDLLENSDGKVPNDRTYLESLPGVGRKTCNVVLSNLFAEPCIAVDTHVARVSKRLSLAKETDDVFTIEKKLMKKFPKSSLARLHHQLVLFGRYYCKAQSPSCENCQLKEICKIGKKLL